MSDVSSHVRGEIDDLVSGRLDAQAARRIELHLAGCEPCRREWNVIRQTREALRQSTTEVELPPDVSARVMAALNREGVVRPRFRAWPWLAAAAALIAVVLLLLVRSPAPRPLLRQIDLAEEAARDFEAIRSSELRPQFRSDNPAAVETFFTRAGLSFPTRVFDLGMMGYRLEGGRRYRLAGRPSALFVYRSAKETPLVCQMLEAPVSVLPPGSMIREHNGIRFYRYERRGITAVFWPEGSVLCVLAGDAPPDEVLQLAYAKAV
jgi:anti-sigma factor RsiW